MHLTSIKLIVSAKDYYTGHAYYVLDCQTLDITTSKSPASILTSRLHLPISAQLFCEQNLVQEMDEVHHVLVSRRLQ